MSHIGYEQWVRYVKNELDEPIRRQYEEHVYDCDECLNVYMRAIESEANSLPTLRNDFTNTVVAQAFSKNAQKYPQAKRRKALIHYIIAAVCTLIFMSTGLFGELTQLVDQFEKKAESREHQSLAEQWLNRTVSFTEWYERKKEAK